MKRWSNAKGEGVLFSIDLLDSTGGEIRGTFFKDACEKFFNVLEEGKVYSFSGGTLKVVQNRQYTTIKNPYEITFNVNSEIRPVHDDSNIKNQTYSFVRIDQIANTEPNNTIDVIGIVRGASELGEIISNKQGGKTLHKRDLTVIDDSSVEIKLTLWDTKAQQYGNDYWANNPIVAFKNLRVGDYGGRSLSAMNSTTITINPNTPEGHALHTWKMRFPNGVIPSGSSLSAGGAGGGGAGGQGFDSFDRRKSIAAIKDEGLGMSEKPDYITVKGAAVYIKHDNDPFYAACPTPGCNKKVVESMNGEYSCEKCNKHFQSVSERHDRLLSYIFQLFQLTIFLFLLLLLPISSSLSQCIRRYILSVSVADHTGAGWFSLFNETVSSCSCVFVVS
jgi:replication factor A1